MTDAVPIMALSAHDFDAVLFDLDGVLTKTASVHASAWKQLFDAFLESRAAQAGTPFVPFDIDTDYPRHVDGKARLDGVAAFLESRGIELPLGSPEDGPQVQSVHALGRLKDRYFLHHLQEHGVQPYGAAIDLVRALRAQEIRTAVVSSSNNCAAVLDAAGIAQLFDTAWTGRTSPASSSRASRRRMLFWRRRGASARSLRAPSSSRTRSPAWQPGVPAGSAASSAWIAATRRRRCAMPAPTSW